MSGSHCGHVERLAGAEGGKKIAGQGGTPYLGALPPDINIRLQDNSGKPTVVADPEDEVAQIFR